MKPKLNPLDPMEGRPLAPLVDPDDLAYGDIVLVHGNITDPLKGPRGIGIYFGRSDLGAEIFLNAGDWCRFHLGKMAETKARIFSSFAWMPGQPPERLFLYRRIGSMIAHRFPKDGETHAEGAPLNAELYKQLSEIRKQYSELKGVHNANTEPMRTGLGGMKVRFAFPGNGYPHDQETALKHLKVSEVYTVKRVDEGSSASRVELVEFPGEWFSTVLFAEV